MLPAGLLALCLFVLLVFAFWVISCCYAFTCVALFALA